MCVQNITKIKIKGKMKGKYIEQCATDVVNTEGEREKEKYEMCNGIIYAR